MEPKAPPTSGLMHAHLVLRDAHHERGDQQPLDVRRLAGHPDRVLVGARVVPADVAADLHRVGDQPLVDEALLDDDLGVLEGARPCRPCRRPSTRTRRCWGRSRGAAGRPAWVAFSASTTAGSGSQSTWISSSASCAWAGVSATTAATPSPVHLTRRSRGRAGVLTLFWMPDAPPAGQAIGSGLYGMSAPVITAMTPGAPGGRGRVDRADVGVRVRAAQDGDVGHPGQLDVVEVAALAGDEAAGPRPA